VFFTIHTLIFSGLTLRLINKFKSTENTNTIFIFDHNCYFRLKEPYFSKADVLKLCHWLISLLEFDESDKLFKKDETG